MKGSTLTKTGPKTDLRATLQLIRQASQSLPEDMEEICDDLKWVEESLEAAIAEQEDEEASGPSRTHGYGGMYTC